MAGGRQRRGRGRAGGGRVRQLLRAHPRRGDLPRPLLRQEVRHCTSPPACFQYSTLTFLRFIIYLILNV